MSDERETGPTLEQSATPVKLIGQRAGNFTLEKLIGEGAMGSVFLGVHDTLPRRVAIKVLQSDIADNKKLVQRFVDEAKAVAALGHPGLVQVFDFGTLPGGQFYSMMEYLEGRDLETAVRTEGKMAPERAAWVGTQIAAAAEVDHDRGIVHRDLKPANVFLARDDEGQERVKILDFGIAKLLDTAGTSSTARTAEGQIIGTPEYMAPEQAQSASVDPRTDVYALGCVLYDLLAGRPPFLAENVPALLIAHVQEAPRPISELRRDVPEALAAAVMRCLEKDPDARFADMRELRDALIPVTGELPPGTVGSGVYAPPPKQPGRGRRYAALGAIGAFAVTGAVVAVLASGGGGEQAGLAGADGGGGAPVPDPAAAGDGGPAGEAETPRAGPNPFSPEDDQAVAEGAAIWKSRCARCHGERGEGDGADTPPGLEPKAFTDAHEFPGLLDLYRFRVVRRGIEVDGEQMMPSFAEELSEEETWKVVTFVATLAPPMPDQASPSAPKPAFTRALIRRGEELYAKKCQSCHGPEGEGDGRAAEYLGRRPTDLTAGVFKLRSTAKESLPLDRDLFRTLTVGMGVGGMPSFAGLPERDRWALVAYVRTLSPRFEREEPGEPIEIPPRKPPTEASIQRGEVAYRTAGCPKCHGEDGRGDGPHADELEDDWGRTIEPPDFTAPFVFIGGSRPRDVYRTMMTGLAGTPMPEGSLFFDDEAWDVVNYILSLKQEE